MNSIFPESLGRDDVFLFKGDAKMIVPQLVSQGIKADLLVEDPPYLLTSGGRGGSMGGVFSPKNYDNGGHLVACNVDWPEIMALGFSILGDGHAYIMSNSKNLMPMLNAADKSGFRFHKMLVWGKNTATPSQYYMPNCEFTGLFFKGDAKAINDCGSKALVSIPQVDESNHPTEKPVALMMYYILNSTQPGDTVIDMFMGSGTTGVACARTGRRFIGIEMDENHFKTACDRINAAHKNMQHQLF